LNFFYIIPDGLKISGLLTWGLNLRSITQNCKLLFLNQDSPLPKSFKPDNDFRRIETQASHNVKIVTDELENFVKSFPHQPAIVIPSCGDTAFEAAHRLMERWLKKNEAQPLRIVGTIFGDQENPYNVVRYYESSISAICGNSKEITSKLRKLLPDKKNKIFHWKPFIPVIPVSSDWKKDSPLHLLFAGRLEEKTKKVSRLPKICRELVRLKIPFQLSIAGDGPEKNSLQKAFIDFNEIKSATVRFLGSLNSEDLASAFAANHIFLLTSKTEGLPMALLEAMSSGLCPVVMDIPSGVSEIISNKKNGILVTQGDCNAFAYGIKELYHNQNLLKKLCKASRKFVFNNYGKQKHLHFILTLASKCLALKPPSPDKVVSFHYKAIVEMIQSKAPQSRKVAVFGAGMYGRKLIDMLIERSIVPTVIFDSMLDSAIKTYRKVPIYRPTKMTEFDIEILFIGTADFVQEIEDKIISVYKNSEKEKPAIIHHKL